MTAKRRRANAMRLLCSSRRADFPSKGRAVRPKSGLLPAAQQPTGGAHQQKQRPQYGLSRVAGGGWQTEHGQRSGLGGQRASILILHDAAEQSAIVLRLNGGNAVFGLNGSGNVRPFPIGLHPLPAVGIGLLAPGQRHAEHGFFPFRPRQGFRLLQEAQLVAQRYGALVIKV